MTQADSVHSTPPTNTSADNPVGSPAESAGELYSPTPVTPEEAFQAIGRLRKDARDEIDRLIRFLDSTDNHMEREPDGDELDASYPEGRMGFFSNPNEDDEDGADDEPSLGSSGHADGGPITYLVHAISAAEEMVYDCEGDEHDGREPDEADDEPSIGFDDEPAEQDTGNDEPALGWTADGCTTGPRDDREEGGHATPPQNRTLVPSNVAEETGYFVSRTRRGFAVKRTDRPPNGRGLR